MHWSLPSDRLVGQDGFGTSLGKSPDPCDPVGLCPGKCTCACAPVCHSRFHCSLQSHWISCPALSVPPATWSGIQSGLGARLPKVLIAHSITPFSILDFDSPLCLSVDFAFAHPSSSWGLFPGIFARAHNMCIGCSGTQASHPLYPCSYTPQCLLWPGLTCSVICTQLFKNGLYGPCSYWPGAFLTLSLQALSPECSADRLPSTLCPAWCVVAGHLCCAPSGYTHSSQWVVVRAQNMCIGCSGTQASHPLSSQSLWLRWTCPVLFLGPVFFEPCHLCSHCLGPSLTSLLPALSPACSADWFFCNHRLGLHVVAGHLKCTSPEGTFSFWWVFVRAQNMCIGCSGTQASHPTCSIHHDGCGLLSIGNQHRNPSARLPGMCLGFCSFAVPDGFCLSTLGSPWMCWTCLAFGAPLQASSPECSARRLHRHFCPTCCVVAGHPCCAPPGDTFSLRWLFVRAQNMCIGCSGTQASQSSCKTRHTGGHFSFDDGQLCHPSTRLPGEHQSNQSTLLGFSHPTHGGESTDDLMGRLLTLGLILHTTACSAALALLLVLVTLLARPFKAPSTPMGLLFGLRSPSLCSATVFGCPTRRAGPRLEALAQ